MDKLVLFAGGMAAIGSLVAANRGDLMVGTFLLALAIACIAVTLEAGATIMVKGVNLQSAWQALADIGESMKSGKYP